MKPRFRWNLIPGLCQSCYCFRFPSPMFIIWYCGIVFTTCTLLNYSILFNVTPLLAILWIIPRCFTSFHIVIITSFHLLIPIFHPLLFLLVLLLFRGAGARVLRVSIQIFHWIDSSIPETKTILSLGLYYFSIAILCFRPKGAMVGWWGIFWE